MGHFGQAEEVTEQEALVSTLLLGCESQLSEPHRRQYGRKPEPCVDTTAPS